jgi:hypothetical protein
VRPSHGRPRGHRPIVRPSENVRVTTMVIWVYLRSVILWTLWLARNNTVFNQNLWNWANLEGSIWVGFTDYGRATWHRLQTRKFKLEAARAEARDKFFVVWMPKEYLCKCIDDRIQWQRFTFDPGEEVE